MFLSKTCAYAVRALLHVGQCCILEKDSRVGLSEISERLEIPTHYLGKILQKLTKHGLMSSVKGIGGGFYVTSEQLANRLMTVVNLIDGKDAFERCGLGLATCSEERPCPVHYSFKPLRDKMLETLEHETIESMAESLNNGGTFLVVN